MHIGSTAVDGLRGKPMSDAVAITARRDLRDGQRPLQRVGFHRRPVWVDKDDKSYVCASVPPSVPAPQRQFLPDEIITVRGRWISVNRLPSGDIAIKAVRYNPNVVSVMRTVARQHFGQYRGTYFGWVNPRFRAAAARAQLRAITAGV